jgi:hypothetical protein
MLDRHLRKVRKIYRERHNLVIDATHSWDDAGLIAAPPNNHAGLHLCLRLPEDVAESSVITELRRQGIGISGLAECTYNPPPNDGVLIGRATPYSLGILTTFLLSIGPHRPESLHALFLGVGLIEHVEHVLAGGHEAGDRAARYVGLRDVDDARMVADPCIDAVDEIHRPGGVLLGREHDLGRPVGKPERDGVIAFAPRFLETKEATVELNRGCEVVDWLIDERKFHWAPQFCRVRNQVTSN